jgi:guanylate kinase
MSIKGLIFVLSAPSGAGKTTLCNKLLSSELGLVRSVSLTTRLPRKGERDGEDYFFVSKEDFQERRKKGELLEWTTVLGKLYGTPRRFVEKSIDRGIDILLSIDVRGALQVKRLYPQGIFIFILPPSLKTLETRLKKRSTEKNSQIAKRIGLAKRELSFVEHYDYVVVNDNLEEALVKLRSIIIAERRKNRK